MWICVTLQVQVSDQPLTSLRMMDTGRIAAVGSADGSTTIVQFSDGLIDMQPNDGKDNHEQQDKGGDGQEGCCRRQQHLSDLTQALHQR